MAESRPTMTLPMIKRGTEFDGPGAQAIANVVEPQKQGTVYWNHTLGILHFLDGSFVAPGMGITLSEKALEQPGIKRMVDAEDLRTKPVNMPISDDEVTDRYNALSVDSGDADRTPSKVNSPNPEPEAKPE